MASMKCGKPGKKIRDIEKSRQEILQVAFVEVFTRGFQGVSVDDIVKKTSFTKGAFYHHFPTKLELGYALVDEVIKPMIIERWIAPLESFENPVQGILALLNKLIGNAPVSQLKLGCPLNNLVQEMASLDEGFRLRLQNALSLWINGMEKQLKRAKLQGLIRSTVNTREAAHFIIMAHEGFYGLLKGLDDSNAFKALYNSLKLYLDAIAV